MSTNYNVSPYYDDFNANDNYHRILFKPGVAVQARELTQAQTILQNQIGSFGTNIFADGSLVSGGQSHLDDSSFYLIASPTFGVVTVDFSKIVGQYIKETSSGKIGYVKSFAAATVSDNPTLFVNIVQGNQSPFTDGSAFTVIDAATSTNVLNNFNGVATNSSGTSLLFHIAQGVFFTNSIFVNCPEQTVIVGKYTKTPSAVIGLNIVESTETYFNNSALLDPALGASNYLAPGADRYKVDLKLVTQVYSETGIAYQGFIRLATVVNGILTNQVTTPLYSTIMDTMAKRTYDTNGDFLVKQFLPTIQDDVQDTSKLILSISAGSAFVKGYEIETITPTNISIDKAQTTDTQLSQIIPTSPGNVVYINTISGSLPTFGSSTNTFVVEIHNVTSSQSSSSLIGTAIILDLEYISGSGTGVVFGICLAGISLTTASFGSARSFVIPTSAGNYSSLLFSSIIDSSSITGSQSKLQYPSLAPLLYPSPYNYTKSVSNVGYYYKKSFTGTFVSDTVSISSSLDPFIGSSGIEILHNYTMVSTGGVFIPLDGATITGGSTTVSININTTAYDGVSVVIIATLRETDASKRIKTLIPIFVGAPLNITGTETHDLMKSDVYSLDAVYEIPTTSPYIGVWITGTNYTANDVVYTSNSAYSCITTHSNSVISPNNSSNWVVVPNSVSFYSFNTGQTDSYYDHGSIYRNSIPQTTVKIIPVFSYFSHAGSIGHISSDSYPTTGTNSIDYANIPSYKSSYGVVYNLNSYLDFRPIRTNDTSNFIFEPFQLPVFFTGVPVTADVTYYLGRIDKAILTRDGLFKILSGVPSYLNPKPPVSQSDSITLFVLSYKPYTSFKSDVVLQLVPHKRYTMKDISDIDDRVSNIEYYTSLSTLESQTNSQVVTNANGTTLFKNGFIVDTFNGHGIGDVLNPEYRASVDYTNGVARPTYIADNVYLTYDNVSSTTTKGNNTILSTLITVPYTSNVFVNQPLASEAISVNPFGVVNFVGTLKLSPESDVWFDTSTAPHVIINPNGSNDNYANWAGIETQWNAWQDVWTGTQITEATSGTVGKTSGSIVTSQSLTTSTTTSTTSAGTGVVSGSSTVIVNKNIIPYARGKTIQFYVDGMSANTKLYLYINNIHMSDILYPYNPSGAPNTSILNPGVKTNSSGSANGYIILPNSDTHKILSGNENIIICDNSFDWTKSISYAQATFFSEGFIKTLNNPIVSTKPNTRVTTNLQVSGLNNYATDISATSNATIIQSTSPTPTYSLIADHSMVVAGGTINFVFSTTNTKVGTTYSANISGSVINSDMTGYTLGNTTITTTGTSAISQGTISIPISKTAVTAGSEKYILLEVDVPSSTGTMKYFSNVAIQSSSQYYYYAQAPLFSYAGTTASVIFNAVNIPYQTTFYYNVTGSTTYTGTTGSFTISAGGGANTLSFVLPSNYVSVGGGNDLLNVNYTWGAGNTSTASTKTQVHGFIDYSLSSSSSTINAGQSSTITLSTLNVPTGNIIPYTITGLNQDNDINIPLTGNFVTNSVGSNTITFTSNTSIAVTEDMWLTLGIPYGDQIKTRIISAVKSPTPMPTYVLTANTNAVLAGNTFVISLATTNVPTGTSIPYTITGPTTGDLMGASLTGNLVTNSLGANTISFTSNVAIGSTKTFKLTLTGRTNAVSVGISNITVPTYALSSSSNSVQAGNNFTISLTTTGILSGNLVYYNITGLTSGEMSGGTTSGNFVAGTTPSSIIVKTSNSIVGVNPTFILSLPNTGQAVIPTYSVGILGNSIPVSIPSVTAPASVTVSTPFTFNISGGPKSGNWYAVSDVGDTIGSASSKNSLLSTGASTYVLSSGQSKVGKSVWTFYFSDTSTATVSILSTAAVLTPSYSVSSPTTSSTGQIVSFIITANNQSSIISVPFTISNPSGLWLSTAPGTNASTTLVSSGAIDYVAYVNMNADITAAYQDAVNANNGSLTTIYAQEGYPGYGLFTNAGSEYTFLLSATCPWRVNAAISKAAFGQYFKGLVVTGIHYQPQTSTISGSLLISSNTSPQVINIKINDEPVVSKTSTITLNVAGAVNQSKSVTITNTYQSLIPPRLSSTTQKLIGTGDFTDSNLTWQNAIKNSPLQTLLSNAQMADAIANVVPTILSNYRSASWLNRNPDISGFIYWITQVYTLSGAGQLATPTALADVQKYFINSAKTTDVPGTRAQFLACSTDPLAQTFFVSENVYPNGVFLTGVDLFFQSKDDSLPVFVQLRPTNNGYPSSDTSLPLSTVWLTPSNVNTPSTLSGLPVATHFAFSDPVYLQAGQYALVVGSNSTKYNTFTGTVGGTVLGQTGTISSQPNVGSLFKSQNASTWTAEQSSDLCFVLYQAIFDTKPHTAIFNSNAPTSSFVYELAEVITQELDFNNSTKVSYSMKNSNINSIKDSASTPIIANQNVVLASTKMNVSAGDTTVSVALSTNDRNVSPVLDTDRMSMIMVNNIVNNVSDVTIPETSPAGGNAAAKYVTRSVTLSDGFDATGITVNLGLNSQSGSSIEVYVKVLAADDNDILQNKNWQLVPNKSAIETYSQSYSDFTPQQYQLQNISYVSGGVTYSSYQTFAVKVVMYSDNSSYVPQIANFGAIATA